MSQTWRCLRSLNASCFIFILDGEINHSYINLSVCLFSSQSWIAFVQASTQASSFHVRPIWVQTGNDSLTMHDFITKELINRPKKYSETKRALASFVNKNIGVKCILSWVAYISFITPHRNCGGAIFSLLFACVCVCVCVSVNKIPAKLMHQFGRSFW